MRKLLNLMIILASLLIIVILLSKIFFGEDKFYTVNNREVTNKIEEYLNTKYHKKFDNIRIITKHRGHKSKEPFFKMGEARMDNDNYDKYYVYFEVIDKDISFAVHYVEFVDVDSFYIIDNYKHSKVFYDNKDTIFDELIKYKLIDEKEKNSFELKESKRFLYMEDVFDIFTYNIRLSTYDKNIVENVSSDICDKIRCESYGPHLELSEEDNYVSRDINLGYSTYIDFIE